VHEDFRCQVTVLSGLPGSGKDSWVEAQGDGLPVVSLDELRRKMKVAATGNQGRVIQAAKEEAREHLRARRDFIWNATNISRRLRGQVVDLLAAYDARIRIVSIEVPAHLHDERNLSRGNQAVPQAAVEKMLEQWEAPDVTECHELVRVASS
jgi:predicted kinase